jgi:hypothetical protein
MLVAAAGCRARGAGVPSLNAVDGGSVAVLEGGAANAPATGSGRLPEDPEGAEQASAEWRAFMVKEERDRQLGYDRRKLGEHRAILARIHVARARYDHAKSTHAVDKVQAEMPAAIADVRRRITHLDHWGNNSKLLGDYDAMLKTLEDEYPVARRSAIGGDTAPFDALKARWDEREKRMSDWLEEAESSEEE